MLIKLYRTSGEHVPDLQVPSQFYKVSDTYYKMPPDAPMPALRFLGFKLTEDLGGEEVGKSFVPAVKGIVVEGEDLTS